eukprot:17499_1
MSASESTEYAPTQSTKCCVLVASHLHYPTQIKLLDRCLYSLTHQTVSIDVYVSMSGISFNHTEVNSLLRKYSKTVQFKCCDERKYQMEHIYRLYQDIDIDSYELIFFADDDDMYTEDRVETLAQSRKQQKEAFHADVKSGKIFAGIREQYPREHSPEFWSYAMLPFVLHMFFKRFQRKHLFQFHFADMFFREFLIRMDTQYIWIEIRHTHTNDMLYRYNTWNNYSITGSLKHKRKLIKNGTLSASPHVYLDHVKEQLMLVKLLENEDQFNMVQQKYDSSIKNVTAQFGLDCDAVLRQFDRIMKDIEMTCAVLYDQKWHHIWYLREADMIMRT